MRITEKGQVTIPKHIRERLGVGPGSEVDFVEVSDGVHIVPVDAGGSAEERRRLEIERWMSGVRGKGDAGLSTDAVMEIMRGPFDDVGAR